MEKDHVQYGDELDILVPHEHRISVLDTQFGNLVGTGIPLFSLGGGVLRWTLYQILTDFHVRRGYRVAQTPFISSTELFKVSGHYQFYKENMYIFNIDEHEFALKPMNCPFHILLFINAVQKHREKVPLPFKIFELGHVHRYELSGALYGLMRVRGFTQDDAHIFTPIQEVGNVITSLFEEMSLVYTKLFHLPFDEENIYLRLSMSDPVKIGTEFVGSREDWEEVENYMRDVSTKLTERYGIKYYEEKGEAAFYGPKIDVVVKLGDSEWQIGTIQFDFNLPKRFKLNELLRETGRETDIVMVHRAYLGSIERFLGVYLEARKGRLPFVLNPLQAIVVGVTTGKEVDKEIERHVNNAASFLREAGIRVAHVFVDKPRLGKF